MQRYNEKNNKYLLTLMQIKILCWFSMGEGGLFSLPKVQYHPHPHFIFQPFHLVHMIYYAMVQWYCMTLFWCLIFSTLLTLESVPDFNSAVKN